MREDQSAPLPLLDVDGLVVTQPTTATRRRRGRPVGTTYPDGPIVEELHRKLQAAAQTYPTLRAAVREVAPRAYRYGAAEPISTIRRIERAYRAALST
jgi:hypothetical protein